MYIFLSSLNSNEQAVYSRISFYFISSKNANIWEDVALASPWDGE